MDDVGLYAKGQSWLNNKHIMGRAVGFLPSVGMVRGLSTLMPANNSRHGSSACLDFWSPA